MGRLKFIFLWDGLVLLAGLGGLKKVHETLLKWLSLYWNFATIEAPAADKR